MISMILFFRFLNSYRLVDKVLLFQREHNEYETMFSMDEYLLSIGLGSLSDLFAKEKITLDVLAIMTHDDLKAIGIDAFGTRFRLLKNIGECVRKSEGFRNLCLFKLK